MARPYPDPLASQPIDQQQRIYELEQRVRLLLQENTALRQKLATAGITVPPRRLADADYWLND
jgi:hypothetical protein